MRRRSTRRCGEIRARETYFSVGAGGLEMNGGSGVDGQTQLAWLDPVEMGGNAAAGGAGSDAGRTRARGCWRRLFNGPETIAGCVAGFQAAAQPGHGRGDGAADCVWSGGGEQRSRSTRRTSTTCEFGCIARSACGPRLPTLRLATAARSRRAEHTNVALAKLQFEVQEIVDGVAAMPVIAL